MTTALVMMIILLQGVQWKIFLIFKGEFLVSYLGFTENKFYQVERHQFNI